VIGRRYEDEHRSRALSREGDDGLLHRKGIKVDARRQITDHPSEVGRRGRSQKVT